MTDFNQGLDYLKQAIDEIRAMQFAEMKLALEGIASFSISSRRAHAALVAKAALHVVEELEETIDAERAEAIAVSDD